jgi:hypothetical protein
MCFLYCLIIILLLSIVLYILNFHSINLDDEQVLRRYGALYEHVKYKQESKSITNEVLIRNMVKVMIAALHAFGFINAYGTCVTGIIIYLAFTLYLLVSMRIEGLYTSFIYTFKMIFFHLVMCGNYVFAIF